VKKCRLFCTVLIVLVVLITSPAKRAFCQTDSIGIHREWNEGFIQLVDKSFRKGFIQHNHTQRLIKFKTNLRDIAQSSFHEKRILSMEYFDAAESKTRRFYTLNVKEEDSGFDGAVLFEIIMEMKTFAVVSRLYALRPPTRSGSSKKKSQGNPQESDNQVERIYIVHQEGHVEQLLIVPVPGKGKSKPVARPVEPVLDLTVLKKFTGSKWQMMKAYVKDERLHLKKKPDLLKALQYYQHLEQAE
jgi:hypothetical protein